MKIFCNNKYVLTDEEKSKIEKFIDNLPHGSGINSNWSADITKNRIYAYNCYEAMSESGMYCHNYDFKVTINRKDLKILDLKIFGRLLNCCGYGLKDYLEDLFF